jgi:hypothetical protein
MHIKWLYCCYYWNMHKCPYISYLIKHLAFLTKVVTFETYFTRWPIWLDSQRSQISQCDSSKLTWFISYPCFQSSWMFVLVKMDKLIKLAKLIIIYCNISMIHSQLKWDNDRQTRVQCWNNIMIHGKFYKIWKENLC